MNISRVDPLPSRLYFQRLHAFITALERERSLIYAILTFLTIVFINIVILWCVVNPSVLLRTSEPLFIETFISYFLQLLNATLICTIFLSFTTKTLIRNSINCVTGIFSVFCLAPLQTLTFITIYQTSNITTQLLTIIFLTFFCLSTLSYFYIKNRNILINTFILILVLATYLRLPIILNTYNAMVLNNAMYHVATSININLLLFVPLAAVLGYQANPKVAIALAKDARYLRVLHYELMILLGFALAVQNNPYDILQVIKLTPEVIINLIFCSISLAFACLYVIVINNIADVEIDSICNQNRPLITKTISAKHYIKLGYLFLGLALAYAMIVDARALLLICVFTGNYYLYSLPPLRLKRLTVLSKLVFSINSIALIVLGYLLVDGEIEDLPLSIYFIYLVFFTIASNVVDLKDIKGDGAGGILTLPLVIGVKKAKVLIGLGALLTCVSFIFLLNNNYLIMPLIAIGSLQFYLINKKNFNELPILLLSNASIAGLIIYLFIEKTGLIK